MISETLARKHFPNEEAIGKRISFSQSEPRWYEVVGVAGDVKHRGLDARDRPELYVPYRQPLFDSWIVRPMYLAVRTAGEPLAAVAAVRREVTGLDPDQPISDVRSMDERITRSLTGRRFNMVLLSLFAALALTLAAVGIYGIVAYAVTERSHEIGLRVALGAQRRDVVAMVVRQGMTMALIGTAAGVTASLVMVRVMSGLLFGVSAADPVTFVAIPLLLVMVSLAACYIPARRATRVDPMIALRSEKRKNRGARRDRWETVSLRVLCDLCGFFPSAILIGWPTSPSDCARCTAPRRFSCCPTPGTPRARG